jgi:pyruvate dehydrogenase E2 component (dihydrolipoamide acetyltransferase)
MPAIAMPRLSDAMESGTIVRWLRAEGDVVAVGDELVEVETDKATMVYEAETAGRLSRLAPAGSSVRLGDPIAWIGEDAAAAPAAPPAAATPAATPVSASGRRPASPAARGMARRLGVDLALVRGTGPGGRIVSADVAGAMPATALAPAAAPEPSPPPVPGARTVEALTSVQRTIARRMVEAKAVPEFVVERDADVAAVLAARDRLKAAGRSVPSLNDFVIAACARALREHPRANASLDGDDLTLHAAVNVGFAVAAAGTLLVPVVKDAGRKGLAAIAEETRRLAASSRDGSIAPGELAGGTFTVSNLGMMGVDAFTAILNPPQVAILAVARVRREPAFASGVVVEAARMRLRLTCDHRVLYGADGAALLATICDLITDPVLLAL